MHIARIDRHWQAVAGPDPNAIAEDRAHPISTN
jgi:hypothetical protein